MSPGGPELDPVAAAARAGPERPALTEVGGEALSYGELDRRVEGWARWLEAKGAGPRARVGLHLSPSAAAVTALHAVWRTGAAACLLHTGWTAPEARAAVGTLDPDLLVEAEPEGVGAEAEPRWTEDPRDAGLRVLPRRRCRSADPREVGEDRIAVLLRTSGSGGRPRGVALSHGNLEASARGARERLGLGPDDRWLLSLHPAHVGGTALVHRAARAGAELVAAGAFRPETVAPLVDEGRVSHLSLVPVMLERLHRARGEAASPASLRLVLLGGQAASPDLLRKALDAGYPVAVTYGLTEAASQVATAPPELVRRKPGTAGAPLEGVEVTCRAPGSAPDAPGEIHVRGPTVARGAVEPDVDGLVSLTDRDGWLATGDLGRLDDEGHLRVTGRLSRRIISGGVTVDPSEVEAVLLEVDGVEEAWVLGRSDPEWGERVEGVLAAVAGAHRDELRRRAEAHAHERLSAAKRPRALHFVDRLPRTATGKVDGAAVERMLRSP